MANDKFELPLSVFILVCPKEEETAISLATYSQAPPELLRYSFDEPSESA